MTQYQSAVAGKVTAEMKKVAEEEFIPVEDIRQAMADGKLVIPANKNHKNLSACGIGRLLNCKINANIGNSSLKSDIKGELEKLDNVLKYGADTVMDLSTGGDIPSIRQAILDHSTIAIGTVPIYEALAIVKDPMKLSKEVILEVITRQAEQGVDYITIHCGLLKYMVPMAVKRVTGIVSRGGSIVANWMQHHNTENPFYECFDEILEICLKHDVTLSLGDGLRPGSIADATDEAQIAELKELGKLNLRCREKGVQCMIEGPGHIPFNEIAKNMELEEEYCNGAPFYVLGPLVVDIAAGYDHITSAIGGTMAAFSGASMLCYVTPKEHLGLPDKNDVREGIIAHKIAAHAADVALGRPKAKDWDLKMSKARFDFDWKEQFSLSLDPDRAREYHAQSKTEHGGSVDDDYCTMCGADFCSMRTSKKLLKNNI